MPQKKSEKEKTPKTKKAVKPKNKAPKKEATKREAAKKSAATSSTSKTPKTTKKKATPPKKLQTKEVAKRVPKKTSPKKGEQKSSAPKAPKKTSAKKSAPLKTSKGSKTTSSKKKTAKKTTLVKRVPEKQLDALKSGIAKIQKIKPETSLKSKDSPISNKIEGSLILSGRNYKIYNFHGAAMDLKKWNETHVHGSGGGGYGGNTSNINISSTNTVKDQIILKNAKGEEKSFEFSNTNIAARVGNKISVFWAIADGLESGPVFYVVNQNTKETYFIGSGLASLAHHAPGGWWLRRLLIYGGAGTVAPVALSLAQIPIGSALFLGGVIFVGYLGLKKFKLILDTGTIHNKIKQLEK